MSNDLIYIRDLRVETVIGLFEWERRIPQVLVLDLMMRTDIRKAAATDSIEDTLDYKSVSKRVVSFIKASEYQLVESLAESVAKLIIQDFSVPWLRLEVNKTGALRGARDVGVIIERQDSDYQACETGSTLAWVSIGSNEAPEENIANAMTALTETFGELRQSSTYQNPAVGFEGADFLNLVVGFETTLAAEEIAQRLREIEDNNGRDRSGPRFSDRSIDLDLILYGDQVSASDRLVLPRPEVLTHGFVLVPLAEAFPEGSHPVTGDVYASLVQRIDSSGMQIVSSPRVQAQRSDS